MLGPQRGDLGQPKNKPQNDALISSELRVVGQCVVRLHLQPIITSFQTGLWHLNPTFLLLLPVPPSQKGHPRCFNFLGMMAWAAYESRSLRLPSSSPPLQLWFINHRSPAGEERGEESVFRGWSSIKAGE